MNNTATVEMKNSEELVKLELFLVYLLFYLLLQIFFKVRIDQMKNSNLISNRLTLKQYKLYDRLFLSL